jgi:metal-responsive CopG/Arc/MetJ family transcriptional regulator
MLEESKGRKPVERSSGASEEERASFTVRFYRELLREIDAVLESIPKRRRPSRNDWIEQAIEEKIKRDQKRLGINVQDTIKLHSPKSQASPAEKRYDEDSLL